MGPSLMGMLLATTTVQVAAEVRGAGADRLSSGLCYELQPEKYSDLTPDSYETAFSLH